MPRIRGLLVEDVPENVDTIQESLYLVFRDFHGWETDWTVCASALAARREIARAEPYDFAIIDLQLGEGRPDGASVVDDLRKDNEHTFVLLLTSKPHKFPDIVTGVRRTGAHVIIRSQLNVDQGEWSFRQHLIAHNRLSTGRVQYDKTDLGIVSIINSLGGQAGGVAHGETIVRSLVQQCLAPVDARTPSFRLSYLTPGKSGAYVCRVDMAETGKAPQRFVMKIGLDGDALAAEVAANERAAEALREQVLVRTRGGVRSHGQYSAIVAQLADEARPLGRWLADGATAEQAREVATMLFAEELRRLFAPELRGGTPVSTWLATRTMTQLRLGTALDRTAGILAHAKGANRADADDVRRTIEAFVREGTLPVSRPERLGDKVVTVHGFGDLHSSNVLVQGGVRPRPVLIDASLYGEYHWGADTARMLVDLVLRVRGTELASMLWDDFDESAQRAAELCEVCDRGGFRAGEPVDQFIDQVVTTMPENVRFEELNLVQPTWHWQWHVTLAKEFLRQGCHPDLTVPRGALALVSGAHHLRQATDLVDRLRYS